MKVRELKDVLKSLPEDANVFIHLSPYSVSEIKGLSYIDTTNTVIIVRKYPDLPAGD